MEQYYKGAADVQQGQEVSRKYETKEEGSWTENFEEKLTSEFSPYTTVTDYPLLEVHLFEKKAINSVF